MNLRISQHDTGITIVEVAGRIARGPDLAYFRNRIRDEVSKGHKKILLDLKDVSYVDSSGLGELVNAMGTITQAICGSCGSPLFRDNEGEWERCPQCNSSLRTSWGQMKLSSPPRQAADLLHFTKLNTVFEVHEDQAKALASFS